MKSPNEFFGAAPEVHTWAPGRVNLLGEHTDYNDGYMLPIATPQRTDVLADRSSDGRFHFYSATLDETAEFGADESSPDGFARYIEGCIRLMQARGVQVPPLKVYVRSNLALGTGLSSSAALEVATLRALRTMLKVDLDGVTLAQIAQQAEIQYAGVNCGIMDQMASSLADTEHMLFLDARTLDARLLPLPVGAEIIVIDSGVPRKLAASKYNERRSECEAAAGMLGVPSLRDVGRLADVEKLPSPLRERARHVVSENLRVLEAADSGGAISAGRFGELMNDSHASLRDDYEVSIRELDELTEVLRKHPDVYGARLTGAGFGGACVALCKTGAAQTVGQMAVNRVNAGGANARLLIPAPQR
ncbi:galactokinase [Massilia endophytica]|uniref:galactokinase n=1 Tax=Massilia endophytica TaxID=2899220 RepID=UPI001E521776|nr:galactokinase [Massilia endophytica]UGQ48662.1 galactokinase [Massilia endophytica]